MKNKKGFTLVEILAVVVILAIVIIIAFFSGNAIRQNSLKKIVDTKIEQIEQAAILYGQDNPQKLNETCQVDGVDYDYCRVVTVRELIESNGNYFTSETLVSDENGEHIDLINDVTGKSMLDDTVQIYRRNNRVYSVILEIKSNN